MELEILHWFESLHNPVTDPIMYGITTLGNAGLLWIITAAVLFFALPVKYRKVGLTVAVALIFSLIMCNGIMKNVYHRVRPFHADPTFENLYNVFASIHDWSFPSGHTSASFAAAVAILLWRKKEGIAALIMAVLISFSRLYLTVHYPTDVLASLILGSLYGAAAYFLVKWLLAKSEKMKRVFDRGESYSVLWKRS